VGNRNSPFLKAFKKLAGWDPVIDPDYAVFDERYVLKVIPNLNPLRPTFLLDYPPDGLAGPG